MSPDASFHSIPYSMDSILRHQALQCLQCNDNKQGTGPILEPVQWRRSCPLELLGPSITMIKEVFRSG